MKLQSNHQVIKTSILTIGITILFTTLICIFESNSSRDLIRFIGIAAAVCFVLCYMLFLYRNRINVNSYISWVFTSVYLLSLMMISFPNAVIRGLSLYMIGAVLFAALFGANMAVLFLLGMFSMNAIATAASLQWIDFLQPFCIFIACITTAGTRRSRNLWMNVSVCICLQITLTLLTGFGTDTFSIATQNIIFLLVLNAFLALSLYIKLRICSQAEETKGMLPPELEITRTEKETKVIPVISKGKEHVAPLVKRTYKLNELVQEDFELIQRMKEKSPKSYERYLESAVFAEKLAEKVGLDSELVYAGVLYHDFEKQQGTSTEAAPEHLLVEQYGFPDKLVLLLKEQLGKGLPPSTRESALVMICSNIFTMYHFIIKNEKDVSITKLINNTFQMHLKKGTIKSSGMSMSLYHKMRQEFVNEFIVQYHIIEEE